MYLVSQLVNLVIKHNLSPESSDLELLAWYKYGVEEGMVEYLTDGKGNVIGFLDWVRLREVPKSMAHAKELFDGSKTGPVLFMANCVAPDLHSLMVLGRRAVDKNKDSQIMCYHNRKKDTMFVKRRREKCLLY